MLSVVFVSNFLNHHQTPLSEAFYKLTQGNYHFISTEAMDDERKKFGYKEYNDVAYHKCAYRSEQECVECQRLIDDADIVIFGSAPERFIRKRIKTGKLIFRYSERPLKKGLELHKFLPRVLKWNWRVPFWKPIYCLSASAYAPSDYKKFGLFRNKMYKWGYFPDVKIYDNPENLRFKKDPSSILWAGRFLELKHPEDALMVAKMLKEDGYDFQLRFIGIGQVEGKIRNLIKEYKLENNVQMLGSMPPEDVRNHMEKSGIFLFTSNQEEGWGAVVNESMNSGCAVVVSDVIGSVPYLIKNNESGFVYKFGDIQDFYEKVKYLLDNPEKQWEAGRCAYSAITDMWNAETAAERLLTLSEALLSGNKYPDLFENGPCSRC